MSKPSTKERRAEREAQFGQSVPVGKFGVVIAGASAATDHINDAAAKNCVMVMCAEPAELPGAHAAITAYGFKYKSNLCQYVITPGGTDGMVKVQHVLWLIAVKGKVPAPAMGTQWASCMASDDASLVNRFAAQFFPSVPAIDLRPAAAR
jgi:hypothetical protein